MFYSHDIYIYNYKIHFIINQEKLLFLTVKKSYIFLTCIIDLFMILYLRFADMAELADALDLGSSGTSRAGSSPVIRII